MKQLRTFRFISMAEGISLLTLLFIAMPLKYFMGMPEVVKVVGWAHGVLFIFYVVSLAIVHFVLRWSLLFSAGAFILSFIPLGAFILDKQLRRKETALT